MARSRCRMTLPVRCRRCHPGCVGLGFRDRRRSHASAGRGRDAYPESARIIRVVIVGTVAVAPAGGHGRGPGVDGDTADEQLRRLLSVRRRGCERGELRRVRPPRAPAGRLAVHQPVRFVANVAAYGSRGRRLRDHRDRPGAPSSHPDPASTGQPGRLPHQPQRLLAIARHRVGSVMGRARRGPTWTGRDRIRLRRPPDGRLEPVRPVAEHGGRAEGGHGGVAAGVRPRRPAVDRLHHVERGPGRVQPGREVEAHGHRPARQRVGAGPWDRRPRPCLRRARPDPRPHLRGLEPVRLVAHRPRGEVVGELAMLAVTPGGRLHVVFESATGVLSDLTNRSGAWRTRTLAVGADSGVLAVDRTGHLTAAWTVGWWPSSSIVVASDRTGSLRTRRLTAGSEDTILALASDTLGRRYLVLDRAGVGAATLLATDRSGRLVDRSGRGGGLVGSDRSRRRWQCSSRLRRFVRVGTRTGSRRDLDHRGAADAGFGPARHPRRGRGRPRRR